MQSVQPSLLRTTSAPSEVRHAHDASLPTPREEMRIQSVEIEQKRVAGVNGTTLAYQPKCAPLGHGIVCAQEHLKLHNLPNPRVLNISTFEPHSRGSSPNDLLSLQSGQLAHHPTDSQQTIQHNGGNAAHEHHVVKTSPAVGNFQQQAAQLSTGPLKEVHQVCETSSQKDFVIKDGNTESCVDLKVRINTNIAEASQLSSKNEDNAPPSTEEIERKRNADIEARAMHEQSSKTAISPQHARDVNSKEKRGNAGRDASNRSAEDHYENSKPLESERCVCFLASLCP